MKSAEIKKDFHAFLQAVKKQLEALTMAEEARPQRARQELRKVPSDDDISLKLRLFHTANMDLGDSGSNKDYDTADEN
jgi:hypothetical protein